MQHIERKEGALRVKSILSFVFNVLALFLSFKMTLPFIKIDQGIQILQLKRVENSYCFLYYFLNVFIYV